ncbi:MAG: hypothetical protein NTY64_22590, partial [Deltaproteobacteria bacterium]|nr:hypothetical protein [Deltaproteobacteria bacterium]
RLETIPPSNWGIKKGSTLYGRKILQEAGQASQAHGGPPDGLLAEKQEKNDEKMNFGMVLAK